MNYHDLITIAAALLGSSGFFGGIYLLLKLRPESGAIVVKSAEGVVVMQSNIITALQKSLADATLRLDKLQYVEVELAALHLELQELKEENKKLSERIAEYHRTSRNPHGT